LQLSIFAGAAPVAKRFSEVDGGGVACASFRTLRERVAEFIEPEENRQPLSGA
jgi:hypothetical protein